MTAFGSKQQAAGGRLIFFFVLKLFAIWLSWKGISFILGEESVPLSRRLIPLVSSWWEELNNFMRSIVLHGSEWLLNRLGYESMNSGYALRIKGFRGIALGNYCLGFQLMYYFTALIAISGMTGARKTAAILTGIPTVMLLNMVRIATLCIIVAYYPSLRVLLHDYIFNILVLGVLFIFYFLLIRME